MIGPLQKSRKTQTVQGNKENSSRHEDGSIIDDETSNLRKSGKEKFWNTNRSYRSKHYQLIQLSLNGKMDTGNVVHPHNGVLLG